MSRYAMAIDLRRCAGCGACVVACQMENNQKPGVSWNALDCCEWGDEPGQSGRCYVPHACMHCENAPCVEICPTGATYTREDGIVAVDYEKCISCQACVTACPYGARKVSAGTGWLFDAAEPAPYEAYGEQRGAVVEKCAFCAHRVDEGKKPACVVNCPGKARYFGDLDDPESDVSVFLAAHPECEQIGLSGLYYRAVDGMPEGSIDQIVSA